MWTQILARVGCRLKRSPKLTCKLFSTKLSHFALLYTMLNRVENSWPFYFRAKKNGNSINLVLVYGEYNHSLNFKGDLMVNLLAIQPP